MNIFRRTAEVHPFWPQKKLINFGGVESRTVWRETEQVQVKLPAIRKKNELQQDGRNSDELWTTWKTFEGTISRGLKRSIEAWMVTNDDDDDDDDDYDDKEEEEEEKE